jgi:predicted ATP-grasp superfamily ATP-dependent carboligase
MIVQPFRDGLAASIAAICGPRAYHWLPAMQQSLLPEDCSYQGGCGPLPTALHARCQRLAETALRAIGPGVAGWVGCDLVLGQAADGTEDVLIEVNPRMTTSYIGLRHCVRSNLLSDLLDVATGQFERFTYADRVIRFTAAGDVLSEPRPAVPGLTT